MFRRAKERAQDKFYRDARVFITVAKEDARARRLQNSRRAWDHLEELLGREVDYYHGLGIRLGNLYRKTYWDTLCREHGRTAVVHMVREERYSEMGAYEQIARDVYELRRAVSRIEQQMKEEE